jgi:ATP-binding cassette subfamily B protein
MSTMMAQATASYARLAVVLDADDPKRTGKEDAALRGDVTLTHVDLELAGRRVLKDVSLSAAAGSRTAVIGPTAAGKTQLLYLLTGLIDATAGTVAYDGRPIADYDQDSLHRQVGFVFQDSIIFNLSIRENIAFSPSVTDADLQKAVTTAELHDFIKTLPNGLDTIVSERGSSLSGGQKQRIMLARALALDPRVLLLDDFTARVDTATARQILQNVHRNYPGITLISVTQQIAPVSDYDQIILLMEGEVLAIGRHDDLLQTSPEYAQIYDSQRSTSQYELVRPR